MQDTAMSARLPPELWVMIAQQSTIDDIEALSLTCRTLHGTLSTSRALWRDVVQDLLVISPNPLLSLSLASETVSSLRARAVRFRAIDSVSDDIDRADESTLYRVVHLPEEDQFFPNCVRLIPSVAHSSTRYAFGVTAWAGVRILSLDTGKVVDSWDPDMSHSGLFRRGIIKLRVSEQHGLLVLFTGTVEDEQGEQTASLWLFQVQSAIRPKLVLLFIRDLKYEPRDIALGDDRVYALSETSFVDVVQISNSAEETKAAVAMRWSLLPRRYKGIECVVGDVVALVDCDQDSHPKLSVVDLRPDPSNPASRHARTATTMSVDLHGASPFIFGPCYRDPAGRGVCIDIGHGSSCYTLHVPEDDPSKSWIQELCSIYPLLRGDTIAIEESRCGSQRIYSTVWKLDSDEEGLAVQMTDRPCIAPETAIKRLGERVDKIMSFGIEWIDWLEYFQFEFDEWGGVGIVLRMKMDGDNYESIIVLQL